jgi:hypothetical protein
MVIYAAATFRCRHRYITTVDHTRQLLVCDRCHHRTELLLLDRRTRRSVSTFALPEAAHWDRATTTDKYSA